MPEPMTDLTDQRRYSNALRLQSEQRINAITQRVVAGEISANKWKSEMRDELRRANREQLVTGLGGDASRLKRTEYLKIGPELRRQDKYLNKFAAVLEKAAEDGKPLDFAIARARMYAKSTQAMFWKTALPVKLPQVPRDGKTVCKTNCNCRLRIQYERDDSGAITAVLVWWQLSPVEHCPDCKRLARTWNPLRIEVGQSVQESDMEQAIALTFIETPDLPEAAVREIYAMWNVKLEEALCQ